MTLRKSSPSDVTKGQQVPSHCSAFATHALGPFTEVITGPAVGTKSAAGSNPVTPTILQIEPFDENVEGLSLCGD